MHCKYNGPTVLLYSRSCNLSTHKKNLWQIFTVVNCRMVIFFQNIQSKFCPPMNYCIGSNDIGPQLLFQFRITADVLMPKTQHRILSKGTPLSSEITFCDLLDSKRIYNLPDCATIFNLGNEGCCPMSIRNHTSLLVISNSDS